MWLASWNLDGIHKLKLGGRLEVGRGGGWRDVIVGQCGNVFRLETTDGDRNSGAVRNGIHNEDEESRE